MSTPSSPRHAEWQPARIPKLSYRRTVPQEELENFHFERRESIPNQMSIQQSDSELSSATRSMLPSASITMPSKKKNSFLGGLFAKEPTLIALAQVEADLKAKHGAATPQKVPHVSSRKMPEHVPKVNSRWDGIPEAVKQREREEKQRRRGSHRNPITPPTGLQIGNVEGLVDNAGDTGSNDEVWYGQGGNIYERNAVTTGQSVRSGDSQGSSTHDVTSVRSQSLRSPSGTSLPEITSFFPHHQKATPSPRLDRWQSVKSSSTQPKSTSHQSPSDLSSASYLDSSVDGTTEHSHSAVTDPREASPTSPSYYQGIQVAYDSEKQVAHDTEKQVVPDSGKQAAGVRNFSKPHVKVEPGKTVAMDAFLAGEAKPLQLDDDEPREDEEVPNSDLPLRQYAQPLANRAKLDSSTRKEASKRRYGLYMNTSANPDVVPWEASELPNTSRTNTMPSPLINEQSRGRFPKKLATFK